MKVSLDDLIAEAKRAREEGTDPAEEFEDEDAPRYQNEETDDEPEDAEPQAVDVKRPRRATAPKLSIQFDKTATDLTEALYKLTAAINAITPQPVAGVPQRGEAPAVKVSITVNVDATPLVNGLTDGVRAVAGGAREGDLSKALRETLKDFSAQRLDAVPKKDASQFLAILSRRLDDAAQSKPLEFSEEPEDDPAPEPAEAKPQDEGEAMTDEDAAQLVQRIKRLAASFEPEDRPRLVTLLTRFGVGRWEDIPRNKLTEALDAVSDLVASLYGEENNPTA